MYSIGYDLGSSAIKAALFNLDSGESVSTKSLPNKAMKIFSKKVGWAEQDPAQWWKLFCQVTKDLINESAINADDIKSIGISYQMHGLVLVDKNQELLRPAIIWCDSRAVSIGQQAYSDLGKKYCQNNLLNSPGNFTASKLRWVKENEPEIYSRIDKMMLPGDFLVMKLSGEISTTLTGLSEAVLWDFKNNRLATEVLNHFEIEHSLIPEFFHSFDVQGQVSRIASTECHLPEGLKITYRAGDQANNAMSLNVLRPGEIAASGGTSGVVYAVSENLNSDKESRLNAFAHVHHSEEKIRVAQLLCINGAGSQYAWMKNQLGKENLSFEEMELMCESIPIGSDELCVLPFGNGAERMLNNATLGAQYCNVQFSRHQRAHLYRASLEGIAFSFVYGINLIQSLGIPLSKIVVANDNLFQSKIFSSTMVNLLNCQLDVKQTTGAIGAAKASGMAIGHYSNIEEIFSDVKCLQSYVADVKHERYLESYERWLRNLDKLLN